MKFYDYKKAKRLIKKEISSGINDASLGMSEDWFWTGKTIWDESGFKVDLNDPELIIGGIDGSSWATPILRFEYSDGKHKDVPCFKEKK